MKFVIDSSIFVKWINTTDEKDIDTANTMLEDALNGKIDLIAPELAKYEIGNVLLKKKKLTPHEAYVSLGTVYALPVTFISESEDMARETYSLAHKHTITYYDAAFLSLAKYYNATLVTDNIKHQGKSPEVKVTSLRDYNR